jgi:hypothetical protein
MFVRWPLALQHLTPANSLLTAQRAALVLALREGKSMGKHGDEPIVSGTHRQAKQLLVTDLRLSNFR